MAIDVAGVSEIPLSHHDIKVHRLMCTELIKFVSGASRLLPQIEAERPRCSSGIKALCLLNTAIGKAKSLLQHCSESSMLYLALTGDAILSRCKKSRDLLDESLSQVQSMVPISLAAEIKQLIAELRGTIFSLDPSEKEAGEVVTELLHQYASSKIDSVEDHAFEAIHVAMLRLQITSQTTLLIEKRSIKKMLHSIRDGAQAKKKILLLFLKLLNKHGKSVMSEQTEDSFSFTSSLRSQPDEASFNSIASLSSSLNDLLLPIDVSNISLRDSDAGPVSDSKTSNDFDEVQSRVLHMQEMDINTFLTGLSSLSWESQCALVRNISNFLKHNDRACDWMSSKDFVLTTVRFLKDAQGFQDPNAQILGCLLLLMVLQKCRSSIQYLKDDAFVLLASFLGTRVSKEALAVLEHMSCHQYCQNKIAASGALTPILDMLDARENRELKEPTIRILRNLSKNSSVLSSIAPSEFIPKLIPFLEGPVPLARDALIILKNSCIDEEYSTTSVDETDRCVPSVVKLLDSESREVQEHAVEFLHLLCSRDTHYCRLIMDEGVIPDLVYISRNGNTRGKTTAKELLELLTKLRGELSNIESSGSEVDNIPKGSMSGSTQSQKSSSKSQGLLGKFFSKHGSSAAKSKK